MDCFASLAMTVLMALDLSYAVARVFVKFGIMEKYC
jgi:hypothetical protein